MGKNLFIIVTTMILAITFTCCQKTEKGVANSISQEDVTLCKQIESFIDKMNNPLHLKSGALMEVDSALWNMEAAINYMYDNIPPQYENIVIDSSSTTITLQVNSGMCSETEVSNVFEQLLNEVESLFDTHGNIYVLSTGLKATPDPNGNLELTLQYLLTDTPVAIDPVTAQPVLAPFNEGWHPCFGYMCGGGQCSNNTDPCNDLSTKIQGKINTYYQQLHDLQDIGYWTNIVYVDIDPVDVKYFLNPDDVTPDDNDRDCLIYYTKARCYNHCGWANEGSCINYMQCLNTDDCNFYLNSTFGVISTVATPYVGIRPANKSVIQIVEALGDVCPAEDKAYCFHTFTIKYGKPHIRPKEYSQYPLHR